MCPSNLYQTLMMQPDIASGQISFEKLKDLILAHVHQGWSQKRPGLHMVEQGPAGNPSPEEFEINGEVYRLEMRNGRKVPVKSPKKGPAGKSFKGKCWQCDRPGHFGRD